MPHSAARLFASIRVPAMATTLGLALLLSACGGGDDDDRANGWLGPAGLQRSAPADAAAPAAAGTAEPTRP